MQPALPPAPEAVVPEGLDGRNTIGVFGSVFKQLYSILGRRRTSSHRGSEAFVPVPRPDKLTTCTLC